MNSCRSCGRSGVEGTNFERRRGDARIEPNLLDRIQQHAREWGVVVSETFETESSVIALGTRDVEGSGSRNQEVVLKAVKQTGDEWHSGEVLAAFNGNGFVRVYEHAPGAVLLQRLRPANSLSELSLHGRDEEATNILADVIQQMSSVELSTSERKSPRRANLPHCPTVYDWAKGFERYLAIGDAQIAKHLVEAGQRVFLDLCASQRQPRLLHGDLQHYNVLFDSDRGWLAIDPKGVIGEIEYEIGAVLRNPFAQPELFLSRSTIERRLKQFTTKLDLDFERALAWAFAQAVLSAIWLIEDGFAVDATNPAASFFSTFGTGSRTMIFRASLIQLSRRSSTTTRRISTKSLSRFTIRKLSSRLFPPPDSNSFRCQCWRCRPSAHPLETPRWVWFTGTRLSMRLGSGMSRESRKLRPPLPPQLLLNVEMRQYEGECKPWFAPP